jgi:hypothetical protein
MIFRLRCCRGAYLLFCLTTHSWSSGSSTARGQEGDNHIDSTTASVTLAPGASLEVPLPGGGTIHGGSAMWSATGGTIDPNGMYTAGSEPGVYKVIATGPSGLADTATVTIVAPIGGVTRESPTAEKAPPTERAPPTVGGAFEEPRIEVVSTLGPPDSVKLTTPVVSLVTGGSFQFTLMGFWNGLGHAYSDADFRARGGFVTPQGFFAAGTQPGRFPLIAGDFRLGILDTAWVYIAPSWLSLPSTLAPLIPFILKWAWDRITHGRNMGPPSPGSISKADFGQSWRSAVVATRGRFGLNTHRGPTILHLAVAVVLAVALSCSRSAPRTYFRSSA